jgi:hypothetical protein
MVALSAVNEPEIKVGNKKVYQTQLIHSLIHLIED